MDTSINSNIYAPMSVNSSMTPHQTVRQPQVTVIEINSSASLSSLSQENASAQYMRGQSNIRAERQESCANCVACFYKTQHYRTNSFGTVDIIRRQPGLLVTLFILPFQRCLCRYELPAFCESKEGSVLEIKISNDKSGSLTVNGVVIGTYQMEFTGLLWQCLFARSPTIKIKKSGSNDVITYRTSPNCFRFCLETCCSCLVLRRSVDAMKNNQNYLHMSGTRTLCQGCIGCNPHYFPSIEMDFNQQQTDQDKLLLFGAWIFAQEVENDLCASCC